MFLIDFLLGRISFVFSARTLFDFVDLLLYRRLLLEIGVLVGPLVFLAVFGHHHKIIHESLFCLFVNNFEMESFLQNGAVKQEFIKISLALEVAAFYALFDDVGVLVFGVFLNSELAIVFEDQLAAFR